MFNGEKAGFTIAMLRDALQSPKIFDLDEWMGRTVIATIAMEAGNDGKNYAKVKKFDYSKFNDKLPPIKGNEGKSSEPKSQSVQKEHPTFEVVEDEIPFAPIGLQYPNLLYAM